MYLKGSSYIDNCYSCDYSNGCKYCNSGFALINDDYKKCINKSEISLSTYFNKNEIMFYSCNEAKYKSNIKFFLLISNQNIILILVQIQIINYKLYCYMLTHSPLPKMFSLKLKINIYSSKDIRNLEESKNITFTSNDESDGSIYKIITFISDNDMNNKIKDINTNIKVEDIYFNNDNPITKTVMEKNICSLIFCFFFQKIFIVKKIIKAKI